MKLWWFKVTAWCMGSWLAVGLLIRLTVFDFEQTTQPRYRVGDSVCRTQVQIEMKPWVDKLMMTGQQAVAMGFQVAYFISYYPVGYLETRMLSSTLDDPDLLRRVQEFADTHNLPEGTQCYFQDDQLLDGVVIGRDREIMFLMDGALETFP